MKIIISPAKNMIYDFTFNHVLSKPKFIDKANLILNTLQKLDINELNKIWNCNDKKIKELNKNFIKADLSKNLTPAIFTYDGLVYKNINPKTFNDLDLTYLNENLRIISGFYGVLSPFDGIIKYRLEMQSKLKINNFNNLYDFWGDLIYKEIIDDSHTIINLASKEYSKCIEPYLDKDDKFITISFLEKINNKYVSKNTYSKIARGLMVNYLIKNKITNINDIKNFNLKGYRFNDELSTSSLFVFTR